MISKCYLGRLFERWLDGVRMLLPVPKEEEGLLVHPGDEILFCTPLNDCLVKMPRKLR